MRSAWLGPAPVRKEPVTAAVTSVVLYDPKGRPTIPSGKITIPATGGDWEGTGVEIDVPVAAEMDPLRVAVAAAGAAGQRS